MTVIGVDACRGGRWLVVPLAEGGFGPPRVLDTFRRVLLEFATARAVAVDIPIGLPPPFPRRADVAARAFVGPRRHSVFRTFPRAVYEAKSHAAAVEVARRMVGEGISIAAFCLGPRIFEVSREQVGRVYEVHPEVCFAALAGVHLERSKHDDVGLDRRRELLRRLGGDLPRRVVGAAEHDVLDAAAAAWAARRISNGEASTLPPDPRPLEPRIWY